MLDIISNLGSSFILGLLTPLGAVCVLPLYPGFLSYLAGQLTPKQEQFDTSEQVKPETNKKAVILLGIIITLGVILFMFLIGILFTTILQASLTKVIGIVSPIAFIILIIISILLIFNVDIGKYLPKYQYKTRKNPYWSAIVYGFFFGAIVIPCNPLFIAALFTRSIGISDFIINIANFIAFGTGIGFPLLVFAILSAAATGIINFLIKYKRIINFLAGIIMLGISLYYLIFVFNII